MWEDAYGDRSKVKDNLASIPAKKKIVDRVAGVRYDAGMPAHDDRPFLDHDALIALCEGDRHTAADYMDRFSIDFEVETIPEAVRSMLATTWWTDSDIDEMGDCCCD